MNTTPARAAAQREAPPRPERAKAIGGKRTIFYYDSGAELRVEPSGLKVWQCRAQRDGKRAILFIGYCPAMDRKEAEAKAAVLRAAANPIAKRREEKAQAVAGEVSFREMAERFIGLWSVNEHWTDAVTAQRKARLCNYVFPAWGDRPIASITMEDVAGLISGIHKGTKGRPGVPQTAVMVKQTVSAILDFAVRWHKITFNPARQIALDLPKRKRGDCRKQPHVETIEEARAVLRAIEAPRPRKLAVSAWTLLAHRLIALTGVRKSEALGAKWEEFDLDAAVWTIPPERMKGKHGQREKHFVALSPQAIEVIEAANAIRRNGFVFAASQRTGNAGERMNRSSLNAIMAVALRKAGLLRQNEKTGKQEPVMVPHGWRGTFSTIMNEEDAAYFRVVDVMLAHKTFRDSADAAIARKGGSEGHYNNAKHRSKRHEIACHWANMLLEGNPTSAFALAGLDSAPTRREPQTLDELRAEAFGGNVVPLRRSAA